VVAIIITIMVLELKVPHSVELVALTPLCLSHDLLEQPPSPDSFHQERQRLHF
jgi:hypothetical protein